MNQETIIAQALIEIGAVGFKPREPITFKSGIKSPVYTDNRCFPFWPNQWEKVIHGFQNMLVKEKIACDVIAGVEAAGIPHSSALGFFSKTPSVFVRKQAKDHGTKKRVEGGNVSGKHVVLVEDLISTGSSSLSVVEALRQEGAIVNDCMVIVSYEFAESKKAFSEAGVKLHTLTSFPVILAEAFRLKKINAEDKATVEDWLAEPHGWAQRHGF